MPWKPADAAGKTSKADTPEKQEQWAGTANAILHDTGDEGKAIRIANAQVGRYRSHNAKKD